MKAVPKMQDVARASGYSRAAVSMALRADPSIPEKTRVRIREVARRLGYSSSPLVAALMSLKRQGRRATRAKTVIAFLSSHPAGNPWREKSMYRRMFSGATDCAAELGFHLEEFNLRAKGMTPARMREILDARRIHAVIAAPLPFGETHFDFDLTSLAVVGLGLSVHTPFIDRVSVDLFQAASLAVDRCAALGYRRIGLAVSEETSRRLEQRWLGGYRVAIDEHRLAARIPPLMPARTAELAGAMPGWLRAHRPDVVILGNAEPELPKLIPRQVGLVLLSVERRVDRQTGIFEDHELLGRIAVVQTVAKLQQNNLAPLAEARVYSLAAPWVPGTTAPGPRRCRA